MESKDERGALAWHVLWSPIGFGTTTAKLVELWQAAKQDDPDSKTDMYFPTYLDRTREGQEVMVPLFPHYVFLFCRWHVGLEDRISEMSGLHATFLRMPGVEFPHRLDEEEMGRVRSALEARVELVREWINVEDIAIGDKVKVKSMNIVGEIVYFIPPLRAMIKTHFFQQEQIVPVKISELERI